MDILLGLLSLSQWLDEKGKAIKRNAQNPIGILSSFAQDVQQGAAADKSAWDASRSVMPGVREAGIREMNARGQELGGLLGTFAGVGAKTADVAKLGKAKEMVKAGADPVKVWQETGWTDQFPDGKWRFEIPDTDARFKYVKATDKGVTTAEQLDHPLLDAAYPDMAAIPKDIKFGNRVQSSGSYRDIPAESISAHGVDPNDAYGIVFHEGQHAVQRREGFAQGGSPESMYDLLEKEARNANKAGDYKRARQLREQQSIAIWDGMGPYRRLAGEAEARLTQSRMNLTPAERAARPPWLEFDVPREEQIVRGLLGEPTGPAMSVAPSKFDFANPGGGSRTAKIGDTEITYGVGKNGIVDVILVKTAKSKRGEGSARNAMEQLVKEADANNLRLALNAEPMDKGVTQGGLEAFYKSLGFRKNTGRKADFDTTSGWVRDPQQRTLQQEPQGLLARDPTKFQLAHAEAQRNAALPVEQGGLGLGPQNTAMERAKAMGFDRDVYHATPNDFSEFQYNNWRGGSFVGEDPAKTLVGSRAGSGEMQFAKADPTHILPLKMSGKVFGIDEFPEWFLPREVTYGQFRNELVKGKHGPHPLKGLTPDQEEALNSMRTAEAKQRYVEGVPESEWGKYAEDALPLRLGPKQEKRIGYGDFEGVGTNSWIPGSTLKRENFRDLLRRLGFDSAAIADEAGKSYAVMDTSKLRSRFAAFDPKKKDSRDLLASMGLLGLLGAGAYGQEQ